MFGVAPVVDVYDVAVGVAQRERSAGHVSRIGNRWRSNPVGQKVLAERGQVRRVHGREHSMLGWIEGLLRQQEHHGATLAVHAGPAGALWRAFRVDELESQRSEERRVGKEGR